MADMVVPSARGHAPEVHPRLTMRKLVRRKSTVAFIMTLPLIVIVACLVVYPAFYSVGLALMNKSMQRFVGFDNFVFLFKRNTFGW